MKLKIWAILVLIAPLFLAVSAKAENPEHLQQLLSTRECVGCDLVGADLSG